MARTAKADGDAMRLALMHPAIKAASVITGLLLQLPPELRPQVMHIVEGQLVLVDASCGLADKYLADGPVPPSHTLTIDEGDEQVLRLLDGSEARSSGE